MNETRALGHADTPDVSGRASVKPVGRKKLIEVAMPLPAINAASAREKSLRHGHPSTLHLWWARRPLAACRAMIFAALVDDPSEHPEIFPTEVEQGIERSRLFTLIEELVQWESTTNEHVLQKARDEIRKSVGNELPTVYDPFCGGGAIPIESQRLGMPTLASDLNPVAVLITKGLSEIPWTFRGSKPVHPSKSGMFEWSRENAQGLAADIDAYGKQLFESVRADIGGLYPPTTLPSGEEATTIAWLWARTITCPNPVCGATLPLVKTFAVCTRPGKEWSVDPIVDHDAKTVRFETRPGKPTQGGTMNRRGAKCLVCDEPVPIARIRVEGKAKRMATQMFAIVADGPRGRVYVAPTEEHVAASRRSQAEWRVAAPLALNPRYMSPPLYGMTEFSDLYTDRQMVALTRFSDAIRALYATILRDATIAESAGAFADCTSMPDGGYAESYATAIMTYLAFAVDRLADYCSNLCTWHSSGEKLTHVFSLPTLSMTWDFVEGNPFSDSSGNFGGAIDWIRKAVLSFSSDAPARVYLADATGDSPADGTKIVITDPPYYDNIPYADLSDFFYVWLRATLGDRYPETLATLLVPKRAELVADPARFGNNDLEARDFFETGLRRAFIGLRREQHPDFPALIIYAFKQTESDTNEDDGTLAGRVSIGWETMLSAILDAGLAITGTWPMTSELANRTRGQNSNALASSVVLVCRPRDEFAPMCARADFLAVLRAELPEAIQRLRNASLVATDLQQAALGPGMAIFSRYSAVLETDDRPMRVRTALKLINDQLAQILLGDIADVDAETQFALAWFERYGYESGPYGDADTLLRSKNANPARLRGGEALTMEAGEVQLRGPRQIVVGDVHLATAPAWSRMMALIASLLGDDGSEAAAARVLGAFDSEGAESIKSLAYYCYQLCDDRKRPAEARDFNALVAAWPELERQRPEAPYRQESFT
jgi:putative DNA methylase